MKNRHHNQNKSQAFTMIELLVVVAIIAILATIMIMSYTGAKAKSRDSKRMSDMSMLAGVIQLFFDKTGQFPDNVGPYTGNACYFPNDLTYVNCLAGGQADVSGVTGLTKGLVSEGFLSVLPADPSGITGDLGYAYFGHPAPAQGLISPLSNPPKGSAIIRAKLETPSSWSTDGLPGSYRDSTNTSSGFCNKVDVPATKVDYCLNVLP